MSTDKPEEGLESRTGSSGMTSENDDQKWYELIQRKVLTPAGYLIMLIGPLGVALGLSWQTPLAAATTIHWAVVFTVVVWAALMILAAIIIAHNTAKDSNKTVAIATALVIAFVVLSGPTLLISAVGLVVTNVATGGTDVVRNPPQDTTTVSDVYEQLTWDAVDTIPLVEVPKTLGWEAPISDPAAPLGIASLTIRLAIVLFTISSISLIVKHTRLVLKKRDPAKVIKSDGGKG
jgi:hypothetical protein